MVAPAVCDFCGEESTMPLNRFSCTAKAEPRFGHPETAVDFWFCSRCIPDTLAKHEQERRAAELRHEIIDRAGRDSPAITQIGHA